MKKCRECSEVKDESEFHKRSSLKDNLSYICKKCSKIKSQNYFRTKRGLCKRIHTNQKTSSKKRNITPPNYTSDELELWVLSQDNFEKLYEGWIDSNYDKYKTPSVDRIDDYVGYNLNNIQLTTWEQNFKRGHGDRYNCINNKQNHSVLQYSKNGDYIKTFQSVASASREIKVNYYDIIMVCKKINLSAGGFQWRYNEENFPIKIEKIIDHKSRKSREVYQYSLDGVFVNKYKSIREASIKSSLIYDQINNCCQNKKESYGDYIWSYDELKEI